MDTWEAFFREKSSRRAETATRRTGLQWALLAMIMFVISIGFVAVVSTLFGPR
jgi:hypothetical protein